MRLPIIPDISTKNGTSNKNARMTNCLKESKKTGNMAVVRPGLGIVTETLTASTGNGLVNFNGDLLSVYDSQLSIADTEAVPVVSFSTVEYFQAPYGGTYLTLTDMCLGATEEGYSNIVITGQYSGSISNVAFKWTESTGVTDICDEYGDTALVLLSDAGVVYTIGKDSWQGNAKTLYINGGYVSLGAWTELSAITCVSPNGTFVTGHGTKSGQVHGFLYNGTDLTDIGTAGGGTVSYAYAVSNDGSVVAGSYRDSSNVLHPYRWTSSGGIEDLGTLGGTPAAGSFLNTVGAYYISGDGLTIYGKSRNAGLDYRAFKWTSGGGIVDLDAGYSYTSINFLNFYGPRQISRDGTTVIGDVVVAGLTKAFVWTAASGFTLLTYAGQLYSKATGVSDDGSTVTGNSVTAANAYTAWTWTLADGVVSLGITSTFSGNTQISGDATAKAGSGHTTTGSWVLGGNDVLPRFRDLVALGNDPMDFAQSIL